MGHRVSPKHVAQPLGRLHPKVMFPWNMSKQGYGDVRALTMNLND